MLDCGRQQSSKLDSTESRTTPDFSGAVVSSSSPLIRHAQVGSGFAVTLVTTHHTEATPRTQPAAELHACTGIELVAVTRNAGLQHFIIKGDAIVGAIAVPVGHHIRADRSTGGAVAFALQTQAQAAGQAVVINCSSGCRLTAVLPIWPMPMR
ncbi:hypothetical protein G6F40_015814 [Rhizopus arrhizus]|nr:hypothetical protein G6F40_015814 [Rhizopus arrhizus]